MYSKMILRAPCFEFIYIVVLTVNILALTGDTVHSWTSPMFLKLNSTDPTENPLGRPITEHEQSLLGSIVYLGSIIGPFPCGILARKYGRKLTLLTIAVPHAISYGILTFTHDIYLYYGARFVSGLAVGGGYTLLPMYVAEIAEDTNRGSLSTTLNIFQTLGCFLPLAIGPYLSSFWFNLFLTLLPVAFFFIFMFVAPETPYYLVAKNEIEKAKACLILLRRRDSDRIEEEFSKITTCLQSSNESDIFELLKSKSVIKAFIISVSLVLAQQLSGFNAVLMYAQPIFIEVGGNLSSDICSVITGLILFLSSFIPTFLADKCGRRTLLIISSFGTVLSHAVLGAYFYLTESCSLDFNSVSYIPVIAISVYITTFNLGLGPLPWTISSETFPPNAKSVGASITSCTCWMTSFLVTNYFAPLNHAIGTAGTFWLFSGFCLMFLVFTVFFIPETRGKSFDEIQRFLEGEKQRKGDEDR